MWTYTSYKLFAIRECVQMFAEHWDRCSPATFHKTQWKEINSFIACKWLTLNSSRTYFEWVHRCKKKGKEGEEEEERGGGRGEGGGARRGEREGRGGRRGTGVRIKSDLSDKHILEHLIGLRAIWSTSRWIQMEWETLFPQPNFSKRNQRCLPEHTGFCYI